MTVNRSFPPEARPVDRASLADACDDILQDPSLGHVVQHIAGRNRRHTHRLRPVGELAQPHRVAWPAAQGESEIATPAKVVLQPRKSVCECRVWGVRQKDGEQPFAMGSEVLPAEITFTFPGACLAKGE